MYAWHAQSQNIQYQQRWGWNPREVKLSAQCPCHCSTLEPMNTSTLLYHPVPYVSYVFARSPTVSGGAVLAPSVTIALCFFYSPVLWTPWEKICICSPHFAFVSQLPSTLPVYSCCYLWGASSSQHLKISLCNSESHAKCLYWKFKTQPGWPHFKIRPNLKPWRDFIQTILLHIFIYSWKYFPVDILYCIELFYSAHEKRALKMPYICT